MRLVRGSRRAVTLSPAIGRETEFSLCDRVGLCAVILGSVGARRPSAGGRFRPPEHMV